jgi:nicotinamide-nucleotide amidase
MKAIILSIGDELVLGQTVDTNSAWISQQLVAVGCAVMQHTTVADDQSSIERAIRETAPRCDVLIISGGIGPTEDDLTRQAVASVMGVELKLNEAWLARLNDFFSRLGRTMPQSNRIQAMIPRGATIIENTAGTAAGIRCTLTAGCDLFVMPGVPKEMKSMFTRDVLPVVTHASSGAAIVSRTLHTFGMGESWVAERIGSLMMRQLNPSVGTTVANGYVSLRINARFGDKGNATTEAERVAAACRERLGDIVFGEDEQTLPQAVAGLLVHHRSSALTVATAESCTGGLLAKLLTDIPGSSDYFRQGWITYSNDAKMRELGVSADTLAHHGAVSVEVAREMSAGARLRAGADHALSITGIAGPGGGSEEKPVGTVCISLAAGQGVIARRFHFPGDRETIRDRSAKMALSMLRYHLLGKPMPF